jgi:hypothetical protein
MQTSEDFVEVPSMQFISMLVCRSRAEGHPDFTSKAKYGCCNGLKVGPAIGGPAL